MTTILDERADETLLLAYQEGDDSALAVVYERYRHRVTGYAARMTGSGALADEVCTEAFCRLVEGRWRPGGKLKGFLFTMVHRLCLDHLRKRGRWAESGTAVDALVANTPTPEEAVVGDRRLRRLDAAVEALEPKYRSVLLLYYGQELSSKEVAAILDIDDQQVRSRLTYARKLLRTALEKEEAA